MIFQNHVISCDFHVLYCICMYIWGVCLEKLELTIQNDM